MNIEVDSENIQDVIDAMADSNGEAKSRRGRKSAAPEDDGTGSNALESKMYKLRKIIKNQAEELDAMSTDELRTRIVTSEVAIHDVEQAKNRDDELHDLQERLKTVRAPYSDAKKYQSALAQYAACLLEKAGK